MKTMIMMLAVMFAMGCMTQEDQTATKEQKIGTCISDPIVAGGDGDPTVGVVQNCNDTNYVQYAADWVTSSVDPSPPQSSLTTHCTPGTPAGRPTECVTSGFSAYVEGVWQVAVAICSIYTNSAGDEIAIYCTLHAP